MRLIYVPSTALSSIFIELNRFTLYIYEVPFLAIEHKVFDEWNFPLLWNRKRDISGKRKWKFQKQQSKEGKWITHPHTILAYRFNLISHKDGLGAGAFVSFLRQDTKKTHKNSRSISFGFWFVVDSEKCRL